MVCQGDTRLRSAVRGALLPAHDVQDLLRRADANLYGIKQPGRTGLFIGAVSDVATTVPTTGARPSTERKVSYE